MPELERDAGRLTFKLVYYGPAQGGKTTNLMQLHDLVGAEMKGELMTLETQHDRTLFFDLLPLGFRAPSGLMIRFRLFTVPGQVAHDGTRKAVLSRADGVVFVADSQRTEATNNGESFQNLAENLGRVGLDLERLPIVVQFNKRDLPSILSEEEVRERYEGAPWPLMFASAINGSGVVPTFRLLLQGVWRQFASEFELDTAHGLDEATFLKAALGEAQ
ncbi:GTP-binding protein [Aromatoleum petrolei]|uniref:GTPase n=1 Tax=Aromatoleum petrolei TaxID=76116 RepID=A0ABX1MKM9_9RHOO|nr:GTPase domain-containing protein [Aromatoleum petrolei]NMF86925.1 GTPase [Aromatoleum petrolei]QTQ37518.1 Putative two component system response regulator [Aromatoleum petrolei]